MQCNFIEYLHCYITYCYGDNTNSMLLWLHQEDGFVVSIAKLHYCLVLSHLSACTNVYRHVLANKRCVIIILRLGSIRIQYQLGFFNFS